MRTQEVCGRTKRPPPNNNNNNNNANIILLISQNIWRQLQENI